MSAAQIFCACSGKNHPDTVQPSELRGSAGVEVAHLGPGRLAHVREEARLWRHGCAGLTRINDAPVVAMAALALPSELPPSTPVVLKEAAGGRAQLQLAAQFEPDSPAILRAIEACAKADQRSSN